MIDNNHSTASVVIGKVNDEDGETEVCIDAENSSDEPMEDTLVETNSTDSGSDTVNKADSLLSDDESFDDLSVNGDEVENEEVTAVEDNEVSLS
ncbi:unnamed protein product [Rotaria sp. Silwood1]|nr:unnamed protein product [Rotaria sp. Silwood1]